MTAAVHTYDLVFHILSFLDNGDLLVAGRVCMQWRDASTALRRRMIPALTAKALEWVQANDIAMIAGSLPLYHHLAKRDGVPPQWVPEDADVWILARDNPHRWSEEVQINGPDTDKLKYNGKAKSHGVPIISTIAYPFGVIQVIMTGAMSVRNFWTDTLISQQVILDSFDHTACMIGMTAPDTFMFGAQFNTDQPTMIKRVNHNGYVVPYTEHMRFKRRLAKYTRRGLAPVQIIPGRVDQDLWLIRYIKDGHPTVSNALART